MIDLEGRLALVVGGGPVAARKASLLAEYGARVVMVAREVSPEARKLAQEGEVRLEERPFEQSDLTRPFIVFAATNDRALHEEIKAECDERRIPCNIVDVPDLCGFIVPSIIRNGELMITISTDGLCPSYSKYQRRRMTECCFGQGCESQLHVVAAARNELKGLLGRGLDDEEKFRLLDCLIQEGNAADIWTTVESKQQVEWSVRRIEELATEYRQTLKVQKENSA